MLLALGGATFHTLWALRDKRYSIIAALTRLDTDLGLGGQLLAAHEGATRWPPQVSARPRLSWHLKRCVPGFLLAPLMLALALIVPIEPVAASKPGPQQGPLSWTRVQEGLQVLQSEPLVAPAELDRWKAQLDELQALPSDDWFDHESQEAADTLWQQIRSSVARTERSVQGVQQALESALKATTKEEMAQAQSALQRALKDAAQQGKQLHPDLAKALKRLKPQDLPSMSRESLNELNKKLARARAAGRLARRAKLDDEDSDKEAAGNGPPKRGPGTAPIDLAPIAAPRLSEEKLALELQDDPFRDALGDLTRIDAVDPDADTGPFKRTIQSEGTEHLGQGGAAVWRMRLLPKEQALLRKYFE